VSHYKDEYIEDTNGLTAEFPQDMDDFTEFLEFFNQLAGETEGSMKKIDMRWYGEHKNILWNQVKTEFGNILTGQKRFDPPFIVSLRVFLDFYNEEYLYDKK
ncbi:MAG: hypothetical protein LBK77_07420, partial [Spirochaetaceae bacterium]|nr:hypothetical protein [Spirochaetaceae bacterium]